jgi:preprotein translocase SecE subunit
MKTMIKNFVNEISQITWISGRQLAVDTSYVLIFTGALLVYFTLIDGVLGEALKSFIANR